MPRDATMQEPRRGRQKAEDVQGQRGQSQDLRRNEHQSAAVIAGESEGKVNVGGQEHKEMSGGSTLLRM